MVDSTTGLRALNLITSPLHLRSTAPFLRSFRLPRLRTTFPLSLSSSSCGRFSPFASLSSESGEVNALAKGAGVTVRENADNRLLHVVLVSPQIPGNTGCIARTCAASSVGLHLVEPLGFQIDDTKLKRAGLDYWPYVVVKVHASWAEFRNYFKQQAGEKRLLALTKRGNNIHSGVNAHLFHTAGQESRFGRKTGVRKIS